MYKDELWYRQFIRDIEQHQPDFTDKQLHAYQVDVMLRLALRTKEASDACETCRGFQSTLSHLAEDLPELPGSKAQRHHQAQQLRQLIEHFVKAHRMAPAQYYTRLYASYGFITGLLFGIAVGLLVLNNGLYVPVASIAGLILGVAVGSSVDAHVKREQRIL
jgi:hypothetical protein